MPAARSNRCTGLLPSCPQQSFRLPAKKSSRIKIHFPAAPGSYKKGTLPGAFLFGKDGPFRPAGRRTQIRSKGNSLVGRGSVQIGKAVPLITHKRLAAPRERLQPGSRSKRNFLRKRRNGAQSIPMWDRRSVQIGWDAGANFGQKKRAGARLGSRPLPGRGGQFRSPIPWGRLISRIILKAFTPDFQ